MAKINTIPLNRSNFSSEYFCIHSIQRLNSLFDTNVFATTVPIEQLFKNKDILLVDDLRGNSRWGMNKIIQRNISTKRVKEIGEEYLGAANKSIKFFPAITVILLPKSEGEPKHNFDFSEGGYDRISGIIVNKQYTDTDDSFHYNMPISLKWDKNKISALVIDGQHRVSAIRQYYDSKNETEYANISIPVSFVLFKNEKSLDLIQATRALFIDVNNTPRLVSEERLIFIDDRNVQRRITAKALGAHSPGIREKDVYQSILQDENFLLDDTSFINRYLIEESGKDEEESRGFLSNHNSLFPWEISNIMTIHRNILGNILLKYKHDDRTRDIRSICLQLNDVILDEIEGYQSLDELSVDKENRLLNRLEQSGLNSAEIELFKNLIQIKKRNLEEIQQADGDFLVGSSATDEDEKDKDYWLKILQSIYNQDCSKDNAFELSADNITEILDSKSNIFVTILVEIYNGLWFTNQIKDSILIHGRDDREVIFNFIQFTHETLKLQESLRRKSDKVSRQLRSFLKINDQLSADKVKMLKAWAIDLEKRQNESNLLRSVVGQEMLFYFIHSLGTKLNLIDIQDSLNFINRYGKNGFFDYTNTVSLSFFGDETFDVTSFNRWSEILMKGDKMKPGLPNAIKGADFLYLVKNRIVFRVEGQSSIRRLERIFKSYGNEIVSKISKNDPAILYKMYNAVKSYPKLDTIINQKDRDIVTQPFQDGESLSDQAKNVIEKVFGGMAFYQIVEHAKSLENEAL